MIKIRSGVFETNSSSTHTCILMSKDNYNKWNNGEVSYIYDNTIKELVKKYSKNEYFIDEDFVDTAAFKDIPAKALFLDNKWKKDAYIELADKFTLKDLYDAYRTISLEDIDCYDDMEWGPEDEFPYGIDPEVRKVINKLSGDDEDFTNLWNWRDLFNYSIGIPTMDSIFSSETEHDYEEKTIGGQKIIALCEFGYDG